MGRIALSLDEPSDSPATRWQESFPGYIHVEHMKQTHTRITCGMPARAVIVSILVLATFAGCWPYDPNEVGYNLNENKSAAHPAEYWGQWPDHDYFPSPDNWRFPFYTLFVDRFVNGDPANDNANGTSFERDINSNQMRHGGDVLGLVDSLDYISGMGIKGIYIAGTILINEPWGADGYSPLDTTLLDRHFGDIEMWRYAVTEIHKRGMYIVMDSTLATLGDLLGFEGYLNTTTPFERAEHKVVWKSKRRYLDFHPGNSYNETCDYPRFWDESGYQLEPSETGLRGCYDSEFDQYGDVEAFGVYPDWQRQLAKFASVQDRLREWLPSVREKLIRHSCLIITQLDIDGIRYDKATQATIDALGDISSAYRACARKVGKTNFFLPGEITGGNTFGAIYIGRGRQTDMRPSSLKDAVRLTYDNDTYFIRKKGKSALDAGAFHYSIYRSLTRFLGMDGNLEAGFDTSLNWVEAWNEMLLTNDFINTNTGELDPRHMFGATNQDVFRWPSLQQGTQRSLMALYIITLHLPGIPLVLWGEEQAFYILDSSAQNYIFGRQPMSSSIAWQTHGCYSLGSSQYYQWPLGPAIDGCHDDAVSYDHRDPSHPVRNILKAMFQMRENYPTLNDGFYLQQLSNLTRTIIFPGSNGVATEIGMWSVFRGRLDGVQDLEGENLPVWLVYQNDNQTVEYHFDCENKAKALISVFGSGATVKNLFYPYDEHTLQPGPVKLGIEGSTALNGCLETLRMDPWDFRAYVPKAKFIRPKPMITKFFPGHDARLESKVDADLYETVLLEVHFSDDMDCSSVTQSLSLNSTTHSNKIPLVDSASVQCTSFEPERTKFPGEIPGTWKWSANLTRVYNGIHQLQFDNPRAKDGKQSTDNVDRFLFRIGQANNPMVFTRAANYSRTLLHRNEKGHLYVAHHAAGADSYRYSTNWGSTWSDWLPYKGGNDTLNKQGWSGTKKQQWIGEHVIVEYWNRMVGSSSHMQHGDVDWESDHPRRFPHLFWNGPYNQYGYDAGVRNQMQFNDNGQWAIRFMTEWPALAQVNVWGMNADGNPDKTYVFGDSDGNSVLDRLPPSSLKNALVNITEHPPSPYLSWEFLLDDGTLYFELVPRGSMYQQMALFFLLLILPLATAGGSLYAFKCYFCRITFNNKGSVGGGQGLLLLPGSNDYESSGLLRTLADKCNLFPRSKELGFSANTRRTVLIATMEYDIMDWEIKIKIGGLGVMAQLMGHRLGHVNLVWVVPCVEDVSYPIDQKAQPMIVKSLGKDCIVGVQYHIMKNITYILLDAPIFRKQKKNDPYPPRMDDLESAIYYSIWNQCIAQIMRRFQIDIYHINDYHGALAPLYILPKTVPVCLSLHNAEFQGRWQIRSDDDMTELCSVFNISEDITRRYIQFGEVFNLLHAAASYLRIHQGGFGIVGVSEKYAERSYKRYPIFWGLKAVGKLPNPDPQDDNEVVELDPRFESIKAQLKRESQKWAGLDQDPNAHLFVFVGRWSDQKGIDLIADVFPHLLETRQDVQLICMGPIIDFYGRFAALKLHKLMEMYPTRVYSRPKFTVFPNCVREGADFVLIPSRDEPFGLVAVEFGRKGVIGIGAKVGGLGKMPGWWYSVESTATRHLLHQFERAINQALRARPEVHAKIRARSITQRFPVSQWVERLDMLHINAMRIHERYRNPTTPKAQNPKDQRRRTQSDFQNTDHPEADLLNSLHPVFPPSDRLVGLRSGHTVSLEWLVGNRTDFCLQNVDPSFDDQNGKFTEEFMMKLELLNGNNSMKSLCIEEFIVKSQRQWYKKLSNAFLGRAKDTIPLEKSTVEDLLTLPPALSEDLESGSIEDSKGGKSATGLKRMMLYRVGYWPVYSFFLAFGQIIAVNSYQIMLLTGEIGEAAKKLYAIASIYLLGSILWWLMFRKFELATTLSSPFAAYSFAFLVVGFAQIWYAKGRLLQNIAAGVYSFASASGSVFFALNFNDEAGSQVRDWVFRACIIQGTQQIFVVALWYWVSKLSKSMAEGMNQTERLGSWQIQ
ncbi:hypothetical protein DIZ76_014335 [Coccidioides immitis]|nr:hypothetical protein DIZ76_014335 [Coccidioides immitis]